MANGPRTTREIPLEGVLPRLLRGESAMDVLSEAFTGPSAGDFVAPLTLIPRTLQTARATEAARRAAFGPPGGGIDRAIALENALLELEPRARMAKTLAEREAANKLIREARELAGPEASKLRDMMAARRLRESFESAEIDPTDFGPILREEVQGRPPVPGRSTLEAAREFAVDEVPRSLENATELDRRLLESLSILPLLGL